MNERGKAPEVGDTVYLPHWDEKERYLVLKRVGSERITVRYFDWEKQRYGTTTYPLYNDWIIIKAPKPVNDLEMIGKAQDLIDSLAAR